jgi:hypothetical protein
VKRRESFSNTGNDCCLRNFFLQGFPRGVSSSLLSTRKSQGCDDRFFNNSNFVWKLSCLYSLVAKLEEHKNDWRRLCELVAKETDSRKLHQLLDRLTNALNARAEELDVASKSSAPKTDDLMMKKKDDG